jgi:holo-[acyl-carrier protein] synthase
MIVGVGIDLCRISRMERAIRSEHLLKRLFHPSEIAYAFGRPSPAASLAAGFAAREAFAKASGLTMYQVGLSCGVWIERVGGIPKLRWTSAVEEMLRPLAPLNCWVSLSHEMDFAAACVVLERVPRSNGAVSNQPEEEVTGFRRREWRRNRKDPLRRFRGRGKA